MEEEQRKQVSLSVDLSQVGEFNVLAITAGVGNGWVFGAEALRRSLPLWEGVECFVDHGQAPGQPRSLRDLGGVLHQTAWDEAHQGIRAVLRTLGPAAGLVQALGSQCLESGPGGAPRVGFSADVTFQARGREVSEVVRVYSVDLVFNPARGGRFLSASGGEGLAANDPEELPRASRDQLSNLTGANMEEQNLEQASLAGEAEKARQVAGGTVRAPTGSQPGSQQAAPPAARGHSQAVHGAGIRAGRA